MNNAVLSATFLFAILSPAARGEYKLEVGKTTAIKLRIFNHNADPIRNLRFRMGKDAEWMSVKVVGDVDIIENDKEGNPTIWGIKEITHGPDNPLELSLNVSISGDRGAPKGDEGTSSGGGGRESGGGGAEGGRPAGGDAGKGKGGGKAVVSEETPAGDLSRIRFTVWKEQENEGQERRDPKETGDQLGVPKWRSWQAEYSVEATYEELAKKPTAMEWHLVDARRASTGNQVSINIHNRSAFKPLINVVVVPVAGPGPVTVHTTAAEDKVVVRNVLGMKVIDKGESGEFKVTFSVAKDAKPGQTDALYLDVRTSTLGASPNPWDPVIMVSVASRHSGLKGNFEAFLYYNLRPLSKEDRIKMQGTPDEKTWMPMPKGTKVTVSQVYMMRGPGNAEKPVEQYVGYGNVIDDRGYFICKVAPVFQRTMRFRIVADTIASLLEVNYKDEHHDEIESLRVKGARAAVTPFGKRVFHNISRTFLVDREEAASMLEEKDPETKEHAELEGAEKRLFWRTRPDQDHNFVVGRKILIPYYGYSNDLDSKRKKGILIGWEGELSTGGHINSFYDAPTGAGSLRGRLGSVGMGQSYEEIYANELTIASDSPGLIYHNHNELHHVLAALIRAQDFLSGLEYFISGPRRKRIMLDGTAAEGGGEDGETPAESGTEGEVEEPEDVPQLPGVIAYWHKKRGIEGGETGYALRDDGTWRLVVQALESDPDERDIGLVLRGYGAAVRRKCWALTEVEVDETMKKPNYRYYQRTSLDDAWRHGFDIFFAASVLNSPLVENRVALKQDDRERRSVDLDKILAEARKAVGDEIYEKAYREIRGADNAVAVAAGLWRAAQIMSPESLIDEILCEEGGNLTWFLNLVRAENPDLLRDMMALGLCPRVERWPPVASLSDTVSPEAVRMIWHPNDMLAKGKPKAWLVFASVSDDKAKRVPLKGEKLGKEGIVFPFGHLQDGEEGEAQLSSSLSDGEKCYWTIETTISAGSGEQKERQAFKWPLQDFVASLSSTSVKGRGRNLYANANSRLSARANSTSGRINFGNRTIHSVLGGRRVLGGAVYTLRIMPSADGKPVAQTLSEAAELRLRWLREEDPGDSTPGIYYFDRDARQWQLVGNKRCGTREVLAMVTRAGSYALMVDHLPPQLEGLMDVPDPFPASVPGLVWKLQARLSEPAVLTVQVEGADGKVVRALLKEEQKPVGELTVTWDGRDEAGKLVPDGTYTYRLLARDESGRAAKPVTGSVTVLTGEMGSAGGEVKLAAESKSQPRVQVAGTSLSAECGDDGKFWMLGLTQGKHTFQFSAQGHFEEELQAELTTKGGEVTLPAVSLTNVALRDLRASSEVFTPDGDGKNDYVSLSFTMTRECPLDIGVYDSAGDLVSELRAGKPMAKGESVVLWQGLDDEQLPQPSGWYTVNFAAHSRKEAIPQGEVKVLLDRGLVRNAHAFPYTFSPNDDGFDDTLEIGYRLEDEALVTILVLRRDGTLVKELTKEVKQKPGWTTVVWDGKGKEGKIVPDGKYAFEIWPKYLTGHASKTVRGEFSSDSLPPEIGEVEPINGSVVKTGLPTVTARVLSDLSDIDPSQLKIKIDEQTVLADKYDERTGKFSFTPKTSLGEGLHIAIAYAQDWAGNYAPPQAVSFKTRLAEGEDKFIDRTKPEVLELEPAKDAIVYTPTPLVSARVRDGESGIDPNNITIYFNGERVSNAVRLFLPGKSGKSWDWYFYEKSIVLYDPLQGEVRYVPIEPLKEGKNHVSLEVMDRAGNKSRMAETIFQVVIDEEAPTVSALSPANGATLARTEVTVSARLADTGKSGLALDTFRLLVDGKQMVLPESAVQPSEETGEIRIALNEPLARNAQHAVQISVRDRAGNLSKPVVSVFNIVEDGEPPRIDVISPKGNGPFPRDDTVLFAGAFYDVGRSGLDEATATMALDGKIIPRDDPKTPDIEGYLLTRGLLTYKLTDLKPGRHLIKLNVRDKAGNAARETVWPFEVE